IGRLKLDNNVQEAVFSPDGKTLAAVCGLSSVSIWDVEKGTEIRRLAGRRGMGLVRFSPDGKKLLAATHDGVILLSDAATGERVAACAGPGRVLPLAFLPDVSIRACGSNGQALFLGEAPSGKLLTPAGGHHAAVASLAFADRRTLISAGQDGEIIWWD